MAGVKPFRKLQTTNKELNLLQDHIKQSFDPLTSQPPYKLIRQIALVTGAAGNTISHGLGRNYLSWFLGRQSANLTVHELASPDPSQFIVLQVTQAGTADLLVF